MFSRRRASEGPSKSDGRRSGVQAFKLAPIVSPEDHLSKLDADCLLLVFTFLDHTTLGAIATANQRLHPLSTQARPKASKGPIDLQMSKGINVKTALSKMVEYTATLTYSDGWSTTKRFTNDRTQGTCRICEPYDDADVSNVIGSHTCAGPLFDFSNGGSVLCAYSTPSSVLSTSNACNVPAFDCIGCDSTDIRYFDYSADYFQILCESGLIHTPTTPITSTLTVSFFLDKNTCAVTGGEDSSKTITSVSCKARPYEIDACIENAGSSSGVTGHCHYGTCWLYCQDNTKQLSFTQDLGGLGSRIDADSLVCETGFIQYGQYSAFHLECN